MTQPRTEAINPILDIFYQYPMAEPIFYLVAAYVCTKVALQVFYPE